MAIAKRIAQFTLCCLLGVAGGGQKSIAQTPTSETAGAQLRILFIGNSHLFVNNVPRRVQSRLKSAKRAASIRSFTAGGARLSDFVGRHDIETELSTGPWNVVVLQEATASFLSADGRRQFQRSVDWFADRIPADTKIVLYQTWPWRAGSRYLAGRTTEARLWRNMTATYSDMTQRPRITVAPVGACWMASSNRRALYSSDGNHASVAGSDLAADVIAATILSGAPQCVN